MSIKYPKRMSLARLPTPLVRLERAGRSLGGAQIWIKRDDLTGLVVSGNKIRKLEYVLADAVASGCDTVVTEGTSQSNHCRATAAACAKVGLHAHLLFRPPPADGPPVGNHLLDSLFGATWSSYSAAEFSARREEILADEVHRLSTAGHRVRHTPPGASEPLGCWGYIRAAAELAEQLYNAEIRDCDVVVPISSGGTYAGLVLGKLQHYLDHVDVHAVPVSDDLAFHQRETQSLCEATIRDFGFPIEFRAEVLNFIDGYVGDGYAIPYAAALDTIRWLARTEGLVLDPVYTGKAFHGMVENIRNGKLGHRRPVVFIHTGGLFSDFAWPDILTNQ